MLEMTPAFGGMSDQSAASTVTERIEDEDTRGGRGSSTALADSIAKQSEKELS